MASPGSPDPPSRTSWASQASSSVSISGIRFTPTVHSHMRVRTHIRPSQSDHEIEFTDDLEIEFTDDLEIEFTDDLEIEFADNFSELEDLTFSDSERTSLDKLVSKSPDLTPPYQSGINFFMPYPESLSDHSPGSSASLDRNRDATGTVIVSRKGRRPAETSETPPSDTPAADDVQGKGKQAVGQASTPPSTAIPAPKKKGPSLLKRIASGLSKAVRFAAKAFTSRRPVPRSSRPSTTRPETIDMPETYPVFFDLLLRRRSESNWARTHNRRIASITSTPSGPGISRSSRVDTHR